MSKKKDLDLPGLKSTSEIKVRVYFRISLYIKHK